VRPDIDPSDAEFMRRMMDPRHGTELVLRTVIDAVREGYEDLVAATELADLLVTHMLTLPGPLVVRTRPGLRWVSSVLAPISFFSSFDPPVLPQAPWAAPVIRWLGPAAWRALRALGRRHTARWLGPLDALTRELGLPPAGHPLFEGQHAGDLVLALYSPVLGPPQADFPPRTVTTGFAFYDATPPGIDAPAERAREFAGAGEAPIVVTLGSSAVLTAGDFFADSVAAARRIGRRAILLVGPDPGAVERFAGHDDVLAVPYLPHHVAMPLGAAVVHQGGVGTTGQALRAGRPAVVVPFSHDQPDNAARCARLGVARVVPRTRYCVATAAAALGAVIERPSYAERAAVTGARVRGERGTATACDAIEAVLDGQRVGRQRVAVNGDD
jgi:UDP:flavonoid glycosyltransferase YjiC (YdhE family)